MKQAIRQSAAFVVAATIFGVVASEQGHAQVARPQPVDSSASAEWPVEAVEGSVVQSNQPRRGSLYVRSLAGDVVEVTGPLLEAGDVWAFEPDPDDLVDTFFLPDAGLRGPVTYYAGFEAAEGFLVNPIHGQQGWVSSGPNLNWATVSTSLPFAGARALSMRRDIGQSQGVIRFALSPNLGQLPPGEFTSCVQIRRQGPVNEQDSAFDVVPQAPSQGFLTARLRFAASDTDGSGGKDIWVLDNFGSGGFFFATGLDWTLGIYHAVQIELDAANNTMDYFLDGKFFHRSVGGAFAGTTMENFAFVSDNRGQDGAGAESVRFDELNFGQGDGGCPAVEAEDCNSNGIRDYADIYEGTSRDCNNNGIPDECDIASGSSADCDDNGVPDECDPDCNTNGIVDGCDVADSASCQACYPGQAGQSEDCQGDGVPDECQLGDHVLGDPLTLGGVTYEWGDGIGESSFGSSNADFCWFNHFTVEPGGERLTAIRVAYGNVAENRAVRLFVLSDPDQDGDPSDSQPLVVVHTQVTNPGGAFNTVPIPDTLVGAPGESFFVGACCRQYLGDFPAVLDTSTPSAEKGWISENFGGLTDLNNISSATIPPGQMDSLGFPGNLLVAAVGERADNDCNSNGIPDECDLASGSSTDVDGNGRPDECDPDCNSNGVADGVDILMGTSLDCNGNGTPDECEVDAQDCNSNGIPDECDIADGTSEDCQSDGIPDECQLSGGLHTDPVQDGGFEGGTPNPSWAETSTNFGTPLCLVADCGTGSGTGPHNGTWWVWFGGISEFEAGSVQQTVTIPAGSTTLEFYLEIPVASGNATDFLRVLMDGNEIFHVFNTAAGYNPYALVSVDISAYADGGSHLLRFESEITGVPGFSSFFVDDVTIITGAGGGEDCNENGIPDECDIADASSLDCNDNGIPDECDIANASSADCNGNGIPDDCDIADAFSTDCNGNGIPDECDIANASSIDCNGNGVPDVCEPDCNANGVPDACDLTCDGACAGCDCGGSEDCYGNGTPDECQIDEWAERAKLTASDAAAFEEFGRTVSISGDTAVVGVSSATHSGLINAGAAYVFTRSGGVWTQQAKLTASDAAAGDSFGYSVSISGDTVVAGAISADHSGFSSAGAAYVFTRSGGVWTQQAKLTASDAAAADQFGILVSISGDTAIVGAPSDDDACP